MIMKLRAVLYLVSVILAAVGTGCRDTDGPEQILGAAADIVTFAGNNPGATFALQQVDDSPVYTLTASDPIVADGIEPGSRVYLEYVPLNGCAYSSTGITIERIAPINQDVLRAPDADSGIDLRDSDGIYQYPLGRTGKWINVYCALPYDTPPRHFMLLLDQSTADSDMPELYLYHRTESAVNSFERNYYASFDIGVLWARENIKGVVVHVPNTNLPDLSTFTLLKQTAADTPATPTDI